MNPRSQTSQISSEPDQELRHDRLRHLSGSILSVGASRGASLVAIALSSVVVARIVGPAGIGTFAIAHAVLLVSTVVFELGLPQALAYYAGRDEWHGEALARDTITACFALGLPGAIAILAGFALVGDSLAGMTWTMAIAVAVALPFSLLWQIGPQAALAQERFEVFAVLDSAPALLLCPAAILGAAISGTVGAVLGMALAAILSGVLVIVWLAREVRSGRSVSPPGGTRAVLGFGLPVWGSELLMQGAQRSGLILIGALVGAADGGVYSIAWSATSVGWTLMAAFAISTLPRSARLQAHSERGLIGAAERDARDALTTRHVVLAMPAVAVAILLLVTIGIPLFYGQPFHRSVGLGLILLPGALLLGLGMAAAGILQGRREPSRVLRASLLVVPASVVAYLLVIPLGGATAGAVVTSVSYAAFAILVVLELRAASGITADELLRPRRSDLNEYRSFAAHALTRIGRMPFPRMRR